MKNKYGIIVLAMAGIVGLVGCGGKNTEIDRAEINDEVQSAEEEMQDVTADEETAEADKEQDYADLYTAVLDEYYYYLTTEGETSINYEGTTGIFEIVMYHEGPTAKDYVGYNFEDLDSDGIPELVIGTIEGENDNGGYGSDVYAIYSCKDGNIKCILEGWDRNRYWRIGDNHFLNYGSGGAFSSCFGTYHIENSSKLICEDFYFTDLAEDMETIIMCHNTTGEWDIDKSEVLDCTEEEFWAIEDELTLQNQTMTFNAFSGYTPTKTLDEAGVGVDVIGNGGYFVQWGGRVYFHAPDADDMNNTALWSDFMGSESGKTGLYSVGVFEGDVRKEADDHAGGPMSKCGDYLLYNNYSKTGEDVLTAFTGYSPAGMEFNTADRENYLCTDKTGHYTVTDICNGNSNGYIYSVRIYKNGAFIDSVEVSSLPEPVVIAGEHFVFITTEADENYEYTYHLMDLNLETRNVVELGLLTDIDYGCYAIADQAEYDDENVYFSFGYYAGTGNFFQNGYFVKAKLGESNSASYEEQSWSSNVYNESDEYPMTSSPFRVEYGEILPCNGIPFTAEIINGDIGYYNKYGVWTAVDSGDYETRFDEGEITRFEVVELVDNYIYVIEDTAENVPEDDVGWRYAYRRLKTSIYRLNINTGEKSVLLEIEP